MKFNKALMLGAILLLGMVAWAQGIEFPRAEVAIELFLCAVFSQRVLLEGPQLERWGRGGHRLTGTSTWGSGWTCRATAATRPDSTFLQMPPFLSGLNGNVQGNLFTYLIGPQFKVRAHKVQPFASLLFGGAHTNVYGNAFKTLCQQIVGGCGITKAPTAEAFAMSFGGGVDIPISHVVSFRPAEVTYLLTRFSNPLTKTNNQNNFRYSVGINFSLGNTTY